MKTKVMNNKTFALIFRIVALLIGIISITLQISSKSMYTDEFMINHMYAYFTIQTNVFSCLLFFYLLAKTFYAYIKDKKFVIAKANETVELAVTFYITITMLVFWLVLAPMSGLPSNAILLTATLFLHLFTPLITIIGTLLFMEHGKVKYKNIIIWFIYPVVYLISIVILAQVIDTPYYFINVNGTKIGLLYPYPFIDPQVVGYLGMTLAILGLVLFIYLFGTFYIFVDKKLKPKDTSIIQNEEFK